MTQDEIIASNLSELEKANERIKMLEDKLASIKQAIAELESQEPVAVWELFEDGWDSIADPEWMESLPIGTKLYTHPLQRTWVGLTDEEIQVVAKQARSKDHAVTLTNKLLREKNT
jgi:hypothetical protein